MVININININILDINKYYIIFYFMSWTQNETEQYLLDVSNNVGMFSNNINNCHITVFATDIKNKTFLEIGCWNGLGSTKMFANAFENRLYDNDYMLYSLECNKEKCENAEKLYVDNPNIHILNEVLWNEVPSNFYDLYPECLNSEDINPQFHVDMDNMKKCNLFLERPELPEIFDFVLLDGGDCTTYFDFQVIKNKCKYLYVNDINSKGKYILNEIIQDSKTWNILTHSKKTNSFVLAENILLIKNGQYYKKLETIEVPRIIYETSPEIPLDIQNFNEEEKNMQEQDKQPDMPLPLKQELQEQLMQHEQQIMQQQELLNQHQQQMIFLQHQIQEQLIQHEQQIMYQQELLKQQQEQMILLQQQIQQLTKEDKDK